MASRRRRLLLSTARNTEDGQSGQQEEHPEHRRGVRDHGVEPVGRDRPRPPARARSRLAIRSALDGVLPASRQWPRPREQGVIATEGLVRARPGEDRRVDGGERRYADDQREQHGALVARDARASRPPRPPSSLDAAEAEHREIAEVDEKIERGDAEHADAPGCASCCGGRRALRRRGRRPRSSRRR